MDDADPKLFVSLLTGRSTGAVSVFLVGGSQAITATDRLFRPRRGGSLSRAGLRRPRLGRIGQGLGDEVIVVVSSLDPPRVEIHAHGGIATTELLLDAIRSAGGVEVEAGEPGLEMPRGPSHALVQQAWVDLQHAPTIRAAEILIDQARGALGLAVSKVLTHLREQRDEEAARAIERLVRAGRIGIRLLSGWIVALAGRPNVGKSRLFNALAGYERVIVAEQPGTTRDRVRASLAIQGWPIALLDTAGLRQAAEPIESRGVVLARQAHREADLVLVVLDRSRPLEPLDHSLIAEHRDALVLANKCDLPAAWSAEELGALEVSGLRGDGVSNLLDQIIRRLELETLPEGAAVPFRPEHLERLVQTQEHLSSGQVLEATRWIEGFGLNP